MQNMLKSLSRLRILYSSRCLNHVPIDDILFGFNEEASELRQTARKFFEAELGPIAHEIDKNDDFPGFHDHLKKCGEMGFLGITSPEEYGGLDMGYASMAIITEENARVAAGVAMSTGAHQNLCLNQIVRNGSNIQKETYLPDMITGDVIGGLAMSESNAGSDVMSMKTAAVKNGDYYVINGTKFWITNGTIADYIIIYAKTDQTSTGAKSLTAFIVDTNTEGFSATNIPGKLGMRGSPTGDLSFDNMKIHESCVLRHEGAGAAVLMSGLNLERLLASAIPLGIAQAAIDCAFPYAHQRKQFDKPIAEFQLIKAKIADMYTTVSACRSYLYNIARDADKREPTNHECAGLVLYCAEKATQVALDAIQILGANGYMNDYPTGRYLRDAKLWEIGAGTTEIRKVILGRHFNQLLKNK